VIGPGRIRRAEHLIDTSGAVEFLVPIMRNDNRGRKYNANKLRVFLIGLYLSIENERTGSIRAIAAMLHTKLPIDEQYRLGIRNPTNGKLLIRESDLYYLTKTLTERLAYGPSVQETVDDDGVITGVSEGERARRHALVQDLCQRMLDTTIVGPDATTFAIDATGIWSWGKGPRKPTKVELAELLDDPADVATLDDSAIEPGKDDAVVLGTKAVHDPDGAWGVKTSKSGKNEVFFGYHEHALVQVPADGEDPDTAPRLVRAFEVTPANVDVVDVSLRLLDTVHDRNNNRRRVLLADNHYHYKQFDRWLKVLRSLGWETVHDLRLNEQGFTEYERLRWAAGDAHCPATPDTLGTILRPAVTDRRRESHETFNKQIDLRKAYAMGRHTVPDETGERRVACPALAGKVGCPLRSGTTAAATALGLPLVINPPDPNSPEGLPKCCTKKTVLVRPPEKIAKLYQPRYWGSREWQATYARRTFIEGVFGNVKNGATENLRRGLFHITGLPLVHLVMTMVNMSYNLRMIENWRQRNLDRPKRSDPLGAGHPLIVDDSHIAGYRAVTHDAEYDSAVA
jgi:hypothetical protein